MDLSRVGMKATQSVEIERDKQATGRKLRKK